MQFCAKVRTLTNNGEIHIGDNVGISSASIRSKKRITIGNNVNIGADCLIIDTDAHPHDYIRRRRTYWESVSGEIYEESILSAPIVIEDDVWIGARYQILKGVHIGARSIIAAGSVVVSDIPPGEIWGGNPARFIKKIPKSINA